MANSSTPLDLKDWKFEVDFEGIAWATFDTADQSQNTLGEDQIRQLGEIIEYLEGASDVRGVVFLTAKDSSFIAGADIKMFDAFTDEADVAEKVKQATALLDRLEALKIPTVAAVRGFCLGGGLEFILACDWRISDREDGTRFGFPEVKLGIFPGLHGTVRSIRYAGAMDAMPLMLTGRMIRPGAAKGMNLVNELVPSPQNLRWAARKAVLKKKKASPAGGWKALLRKSPVRGQIANKMRAETAKKVREDHYPAPFRLIDLFEQFGGDEERMKAAETRLFAPLMVSDTSRNLRRVYFLSEKMKALAPKNDFKPLRVHVIGAGTMGADIAAWCVVSGMQVSIQDLDEEQIKVAQKRANKLFKKRLKKPIAVAAADARLIADPKGDHVPRADVIIEAIVENLDIKRKVFTALEPRLKEGAVLATNTSSLPIEDIAEPLKDPSRLIGLHFFNPVPQLPLVEVVKSPVSAQEEVEKGCTFVTEIKKFPLITKSTAGFLVNRVLAPYMMNAMSVYEGGAERERIDAAAREFGMPMGPLELADQVGLDVCAHVGEILGLDKGAGKDSKLVKLVEAGKLGKKSGEGFYTWDGGKAVKSEADYDKAELLALGKELVQPLIDECRKCLEEKVVDDKDLVDGGVIFGTGFAPFRGGPLHYADSSTDMDSGAQADAVKEAAE